MVYLTLFVVVTLISIAGLWEYFSLSRRLPDSDVPHASDTLIVLLGLTVVVAAVAAGIMLALR